MRYKKVDYTECGIKKWTIQNNLTTHATFCNMSYEEEVLQPHGFL